MRFYGTIGPACSSEQVLEEMFRQGMTGVRLNLSHVSLAGAGEQIEMLNRAAAAAGVKAELLIDMQGPELRTGSLSGPVELCEGETVRLGEDGVPVPAVIMPCLQPGMQLLVDDGKLLLEVLRVCGGSCETKVLRGGILRSRKSIAIPGVNPKVPAMTQQDMESVRLAAGLGVTAVMQPFVRSSADLMELRAALDAADGEGIRILAKIENLEGVGNLEKLMPWCDEIVIARGDLGNAVQPWELPGLQKKIAAACRGAGKPFMTVTQMLASMEHSPVPTRAEVCDIYNAVLDGSSSLMVTGETAVGSYPVEVMKILVKTAEEALKAMH